MYFVAMLPRRKKKGAAGAAPLLALVIGYLF